MDWYPLWNSLRIALISCAAVFFLGIFAAYYIAKLPRVLKGVLDVVLTLPMVLPPTVVGYFLLLLFGAKRPLGIFFMEHFGVRLVMNWYSAIFASIVVAFPLMYRTARGAFESFDETLAWSAQTLGLSNTWIFWRVRMPCCRQGILAGTVLAFARALGEYGATSMIAGYTPLRPISGPGTGRRLPAFPALHRHQFPGDGRGGRLLRQSAALGRDARRLLGRQVGRTRPRHGPHRSRRNDLQPRRRTPRRVSETHCGLIRPGCLFPQIPANRLFSPQAGFMLIR